MRAVPIPEPCNVDWRTMTSAEGGRFCGACKKVVKNLSSLTEREARRLLRNENNGSLCVRYAYDKHGKILFGADAPKDDPPIPVRSLLRRVGAAAGLALAVEACSASPLDAVSSDTTQERQRVDDRHHEDEPQWNQGGALPMPDLTADDSQDAGASADGSTSDAASPDGGEVLN